MANALTDVQATFLALDQHYTMLLAACPTQADRDALGVRYAVAQRNYYACENQVLSTDDSEVTAICLRLQTANQVVSQAEKEMGAITNVIDHIDSAVTLGQQLIAKAGL